MVSTPCATAALIPDVLERLHAQRCERILVLPLYPQYAGSTTGSVVDAVAAAISRMRNVPALRTVKHYHDHPGYIGALAQNLRDYWMKNGRPDKLVMSFHGVPRFTLDKGDPYHCECQKTARLLGPGPTSPYLTFQSASERRVAQALHCARWNSADRSFSSGCGVPGFVKRGNLEEIAMEGKPLLARRKNSTMFLLE